MTDKENIIELEAANGILREIIVEKSKVISDLESSFNDLASIKANLDALREIIARYEELKA